MTHHAARSTPAPAWSRPVTGMVLALALGCGLTDPVPTGVEVALELVAQLPAAAGNPIQLAEAPDGSGRIFVLGQRGWVHVLSGGVLDATPILHMRARGVPVSFRFEGGALELVFHPNFAGLAGPAGHGLFYTQAHEDWAGAPDFDHPELAASAGDGQTVVREWQMSGANLDTVAPGSRVLMRIDQPASTHNGGGMAFDSAGRLLIAVGDGGGSGGITDPSDGHTDGIGNGQDRTNVFGNVLRIDPLGSDSANGQYGIPLANPFEGNANGWLEEIYAWGLRNPYRISVDALDQVWAADVGQDSREEVDLLVQGGNHGWPFFEGTRVNRVGGPAGTVMPLGEYTHDDGVAVIGGNVYTGAAIPALQGRYVFGDFGPAVGRLFSMDTATGAISEFILKAGSAAVPGALFGIGRDAAGEIYYLMRPFTNDPSSILRLVAAPGDQDGDGVDDADDLCRGVPDAGQGDDDSDGVGDACDVCTAIADPAQFDRDLDGYGNACDCDFDNNGSCNIEDFSAFLADFQTQTDSGSGTDMNVDGTVSIEDFGLFLSGFQAGLPGPSGLAQ